MTHYELDDAIIICLDKFMDSGDMSAIYFKEVGRIPAMKHIAEVFWTYDVKDNEYSDKIKKQLVNLSSYGKLILDGDKP